MNIKKSPNINGAPGARRVAGTGDSKARSRTSKDVFENAGGRPRQRDICGRRGQINGNLINPGKREIEGDVRLIRSIEL